MGVTLAMEEAFFKVFADHIIWEDMSDGTAGISEDTFLSKFDDAGLYGFYDAQAAKIFFDKHAEPNRADIPWLTYKFCDLNSHPYKENPYTESFSPFTEEDLAKIRTLCEEAGMYE